ncbi:hypothetical protein BGZ99_008665 [Dissophora globulifera]|uniref:F-box domain-containing protein n=1 Tax=Dissophora globulifera TaxID=979702 RepID=A0A9P6R6Q4_9FUNG|nr:hypothetical protein BGZ99_008665 [Dissophora globulifera]
MEQDCRSEFPHGNARLKTMNEHNPDDLSQSDSSMPTARLHTLPAEIIFWIMGALPPHDILSLTQVSLRLRTLSLASLAHTYNIELEPICVRVGVPNCMPAPQLDDNNNDPPSNSSRPGSHTKGQWRQPSMSSMELYTRLQLSELYYTEMEMLTARTTDSSAIIAKAFDCSARILRRLYLSDPCNGSSESGVSNYCGDHSVSVLSPLMLNPFSASKENLHIIAQVIADQVCRGLCLPETAVLVLQTLTSLRDQDQFHFLVINPDRSARLQVPSSGDEDEHLSIGEMCLQYLIPVILLLLEPPVSSPPARTMDLARFPALICRTLSTQTDRRLSLHIRSVQHLTRVLCFLPLLGRHFNVLPTSTFIETFLDRSKGDLPIDRAAVMVYGFMCVLDLETGKANLASDSYRIFERSMPTQGVVQAREIVRIVERHRMLIRALLAGSPTSDFE